MISQIAGLPAHPFFVHGAVVLIPLTALLVIAWAFVPRWRAALGWPTALGAIVSVVAVFVTRESGDALAQGRDLGMHETYADMFTIATIAMAALIAVLFFIVRRGLWAKAGGWVVRIVATVAAIAVLVTAALTGHSGASLVWKDEQTGGEQTTSQQFGGGDGDGDAS